VATWKHPIYEWALTGEFREPERMVPRMRATTATLDVVAAIGLAIGGALGLAGTFVAGAELRESLWMIDGVAIVVATELLTVKYLRQGNDFVAAGDPRRSMMGQAF
jgi:hypothetical protein